ncbi:flavodoxin family protein [Cuneatibacter sp. NSJ-177]|uniref:flavodoxin family protein n=1 Tax=Cuneatibacter sp. NSJ-177 TaxID=2931401 RepID=UPI001FD18314|nr:flavodoxin family protein [Cuneatibacter sp. NSJ-177]MCJ7835442.1 flavodoxin family protein [Cuneatibacter sp. NSJ-177]
MKIVLITGSPHKKGTSALLAEEFIRGAEEAGHTVARFDAAFQEVGNCRACNYCRNHDGECIQKDGMEQLLPILMEAELVVFAMPLYYFGMPAQIKSVIDRFYAKNSKLLGSGKKAALLATCADTAPWALDVLTAHYQTICRYLQWEDAGMVLAPGVGVRKDIEETDYPEKAWEFGKSL